jgi:DNA-binding transcriptional regulator YiaG
VQPLFRDEHLTYQCKEGEYLIEATRVPVEVCESCGEAYSGLQAALIRTEAIARALRLLPAGDILALRESTGRTQAEFARLTGIIEKDLSDWERGRALPDRAMDWYLRLLIHNPDNVHLLEELHRRAKPSSAVPANGPSLPSEPPAITPVQASAAGTESSH